MVSLEFLIKGCKFYMVMRLVVFKSAILLYEAVGFSNKVFHTGTKVNEFDR